MDRAVLIHSIMIGEEVKVENLIPKYLSKIAHSMDPKSRLGFSNIIHRLFAAAGLIVEYDIHIPMESPITAAAMESKRGGGHQNIHNNVHEHPPPPEHQEGPSQGQEQVVSLEQFYKDFQAFQVQYQADQTLIKHMLEYICIVAQMNNKAIPSFWIVPREEWGQKTQMSAAKIQQLQQQQATQAAWQTRRQEEDGEGAKDKDEDDDYDN
ncbi:hypothetical protein PIB30_026093 [Stylosanthes scabra]|uniref:Uncharacterized protein n=1 Tax=Stylosanthes scabra TaxID=79078 RepID=A0ABU6SAB4_9FABA|nr:hypothetical protein [Stylosanthes scabra]